jgi:hypothetical protein
MNGGNVNTWRNCTYESCTLVVKKFFNNPNLVAHYNYNVIHQKSQNVIDYMRKYGVYKLPYMKDI